MYLWRWKIPLTFGSDPLADHENRKTENFNSIEQPRLFTVAPATPSCPDDVTVHPLHRTINKYIVYISTLQYMTFSDKFALLEVYALWVLLFSSRQLHKLRTN